MKILILFLIITSSCFAQDITIEERVTSLEQRLVDLPSYVEEHCELVLYYSGTTSMGCFNSVVSSVRTDIRMYGSSFYVTNWSDCKQYRLVCN